MLGPKVTLGGVARELGITRGAVTRIAKAYEKGGEPAVQELHWGRGRPLKTLFLTQAEIDWLVSVRTLTQQAGLSLEARALQFTIRFGKPLNRWQLRDLYKGRGVTLQKPQARLGPELLPPPEEQMERIRQAQEEVKEAEDEGREIICVDEATFSSKRANAAQWAPSGHPLEWDVRFFSGPYISVCGATSRKRGLFFYRKLVGEAYTQSRFLNFLRSLHNVCSKDYIALYLDQGSMHRGQAIEDYCEKFDIRLIWNPTSRPEFNGIEPVWSWAKREYKARLDW